MIKFCALTCRPAEYWSTVIQPVTSEYKTKWNLDILGNCNITPIFRNVESGFLDYLKFTAWTSFFHPQ
jgi:hypothetical protein